MQPQNYFLAGAAAGAAGAAGAAAGAAGAPAAGAAAGAAPSAGFASAAGAAAGAAGAAAGLASSFLPQADKATANIAAKSSDFFSIISFKLKTIYIRFTAITGNCCRT